MKRNNSRSKQKRRSKVGHQGSESKPKEEAKHSRPAAAIMDGGAVFPWEKAVGFPVGGVRRDELIPPVQEAYLQAVALHAHSILGHHWEKYPRAFEELSGIPPEGCDAVARFLARAFVKTLPELVVNEEQFWEDYCCFNFRACHDYAEDDGFKAYLRHRIGKPGLMNFLQRAVENFAAKETPDIGGRMVFGIYWDLFILPLRFWSDEASAELFTVSGRSFNLDKVRNTRRELGLKRSQPVIVKRFKRMPPASPGSSEQIDIQLDDKAAERLGVPGMQEALVQYFKTLQQLGRKPA